MNERRLHPFTVLRFLRKTLVVYLLPLVPVSYTHLTLPTT